MKFLVDQNLSRRVAEGLIAAGHDAVHVADLGLSRATDAEILSAAVEGDRIIVSAATDFGTLLSLSGDNRPSVLLVRRSTGRAQGLLRPTRARLVTRPPRAGARLADR